MDASSDEDFMRRAIELAAADPQAPAVGCVIVLHGHLIGAGTHVIRGGYDPAAHAELLALRRAGETVRRAEVPGAVLYSTLLPCGLCLMAGVWSKVSRIVYGAGRQDVPEQYFEGRDPDAEQALLKTHSAALTINGGILRQECAALYP